MKDDLSPVLEKIKTADAVIFGAPIYFMNLSAGMIAFIERLFFSNYIYSAEIPTVFPKKLPNAFFYTMSERVGLCEGTAERILGVKPKILCAFNTVQFKDYSKYESSIFDAEEKFAYREKNWQTQLDDAFKIGRELILS